MVTEKLIFITVISSVLCLVQSTQNPTIREKIDRMLDTRFLKTSIKKFGAPQPYEKYDLPGPEVVLDEAKKVKNIFIYTNENVTYKYRSNSKHFSYNECYEDMRTLVHGTEKVTTIKGQVTEKIPRTYGSYYLRTVGYISNDSVSETFLIDISTVETRLLKNAN